MSGNFIRVIVSNVNAPKRIFTRIQRETIPAATDAAADYLIGDERRGLRHLALYKYVSRKRAYGVTFFSEKQRRFVMAAIRDGRINPGVNNRTGAIPAGWKVEGRSGSIIRIVNRAPGVGFVQGDVSQARQPAMVGHRKVSDVIASNLKGMIRAAQQAVNRILKGL